MTPLPENNPIAVNCRLYLEQQAGLDIALDAVRRARDGASHYHDALTRLMPPDVEHAVRGKDGNLYRIRRLEVAGPVTKIPYVVVDRIREDDTEDYPAGMTLDGAPAIPAEVASGQT